MPSLSDPQSSTLESESSSQPPCDRDFFHLTTLPEAKWAVVWETEETPAYFKHRHTRNYCDECFEHMYSKGQAWDHLCYPAGIAHSAIVEFMRIKND